MCRAAKIKPGDFVIDPMAGSAMIPIEGSLAYPDSIFMAGELSSKELNIGYINIKNHTKSSNVIPIRWDVKELPLKSGSIDIVISDLPFGRRHLSYSKNLVLYPKLMKEIARVCKIGARAVLLSLEKGLMRKTLANEKGWNLIKSYQVDVGGLDVELYILDRIEYN